MMSFLMIIFNMASQFHLEAKGTTTYIANEFFLFFMDNTNMLLLVSIASVMNWFDSSSSLHRIDLYSAESNMCPFRTTYKVQLMFTIGKGCDQPTLIHINERREETENHATFRVLRVHYTSPKIISKYNF